MNRTLTRDQIIAAWNAPSSPLRASIALADAPPPAPVDGDDKTPPVAEPANAPTEAEADATVTTALKALSDAASAALKAQQADPGGATDPNDAKVLAGLEAVVTQVAQIEKDQEADNAALPADADGEAPGDDAAPVDKPAPVAAAALAPTDGEKPGNAAGIPGDGDDSPPNPGDIANDAVCGNPDCGHLGSLHEDTADGTNQGHCQTPDCECPGMVPPADMLNTDDNDGEPEASPEAPAPAPGVVAAAALAEAFAPGDAPAPPDAAPAPPVATPAAPSASAPASGDDLPDSDPTPDDGMAMGPAFIIPVGIVEDTPTGDGRQIAPEALTWRECPLPLMGLDTSTHDPNGYDLNDPAELIGRIDMIRRAPGNSNVLQAQGFLLGNDVGMEWATIIEQMQKMGVSADVGEAEVDSTIDLPMPSDGGGFDPTDMMDIMDAPILEMLTSGVLHGFTVVPTPAFASCYIELGTELPDDPELPVAPPVDTPAPTDTTAPTPAPVLASVTWRLIEEECEPCAAGITPLLATAGVGPLAPPSDWFTDPAFGPDDDRLRETLDARTGRATGKFACPTTITEDGEVFGHLAQWGVCHTSPMYKNQCMLAPRSSSGYSHWYTGQVKTAEGDLVDVGALTAGTGHAGMNLSLAAALAHYDDVRYQVANVVVGEDDYGIWFHGALHPSATPEQVYTLRASALSGDWRPQGTRLELVAALAVNRPGFPQVKAHRVAGRITSLVAAGAPTFEVELAPLTIEERVALMERTMPAMLPLAKESLGRRMDAIRGG